MDHDDLKSLVKESPLDAGEKQELILLLEEKGADEFLSRFEEMYVKYLQALEQREAETHREIDEIINSVENEYAGEREKLNDEADAEKIALLRGQTMKKAQTLTDDLLNKLKEA